MSKLQQLLESAKTFEDRSKVMNGLIAKWEPYGLLEGAACNQTQYDKGHMALILENELKRILVETTNTNSGGSHFAAGSGEQWAGIALPMVRKVFGEITSKEFLSNQPMNMPYGLVFYLDFRYSNSSPGAFNGGTRFNAGDSIYGNTFTSSITNNVDPFGGLYGAGRFGYSINDYNATVPTASVTAATASFADVNFNGYYSASISSGSLTKVTIASASVNISNLDVTAVRSFVFTSSAVKDSILLPEFTSYNQTFDQLQIIVSGSVATNVSSSVVSGPISVYYSIKTKDNLRGDFENTAAAPLTGSNAIPSIDISPRSEDITAKTRKLKYSYTQEAQQDYQTFQSIDIEAESTSLLSEYISKEIDLELLDLINQAANETTAVWSARSNRFFDPTTNTFSDQAAGSGGYYNSQGEWFETLGTKIQQVSRKIHAKTQRGEANVLMCGPVIAAVIESISGYTSNSDGTKMEYAFGSKEAGKLKGKYKIIVNSYMQENTILMAFKGTNFLDTGGVFAPYIPLISTPLVYDPTTFQMNKGLMTRYGKRILLPQFFGKVWVADLQSV